jgi:hypothetical protein
MLSKILAERGPFLTLSLVLVLGLGVRLLFLAKTSFVIDSDEAIVGLMAKHILDGRTWPVFYYGQDYMGSLEAILASLSFATLGMSSASLKLVPLLFSVLQIGLVYALAHSFVGKRASLIAALLCALGPVTLILWSGKARGGFIEMMVLGTIALVLSCQLLTNRQCPYNRARFQSVCLGLVLGLGWWVNNQISFYMLPIGLVVGSSFFINRPWKSAITLGLWCLSSFLLGGAAFWYANIFGDPQWATFDVLFGDAGEVDMAEHFVGLFNDALPIIFGARRFWSNEDVFPFATQLFYIAYGLSLSALLYNAFTQREKRMHYLLILSFIASVMFIFAASKFGWLSRAPRYILPLYSVNFIVLAIGLEKLFSSRSPYFRCSAFCSLVILVLAQLAPLAVPPGITVGQPFVFEGDRVAKDQSELYRWLRSNGYKHIFTNYWIGYRVAFETSEEITFSRFSDPLTLRIPEYELHEDKASRVYVLTPHQVANFTARLDVLGYQYRITKVGEYVVADQIAPKWPRVQLEERLVALSPKMLDAPTRKDWLAYAIDADESTRWGSGEPQHPQMYFDVNFDELVPVSHIEIEFGNFTHDAPRHLLIQLKREDGSWLEVADLGDTNGMRGFSGFGDKLWKIGFTPVEAKALRLAQKGEHPVFDWSIAELRVYRAIE